MEVHTMFYVLAAVVIGILLCLGALVYISFRDRSAEKAQMLKELQIPELNSVANEAGGFWKNSQPMPVRDIAFSSEERELARAAATALTAVAESQPDTETVNVERKPKFDYPNFDGFPCDSDSFDDFSHAMMNHGFVIRFIMKTGEVQLIYSPPKARQPMEVLRRLYNVPALIFPSNLLHDEGRKRTALWAMRKFKREEKQPALENFTYL